MIPFNAFLKFKYSRLFFLIKVIRLLVAYDRILDIKKLNHAIREAWFRKQHEKVCKDDDCKYDSLNDHNKILQQIILVYSLRTMKLVFTILQFSYYTGLIWFIFCDIAKGQGWYTAALPAFADKFGLTVMTSFDVAILTMYWAFTTLSTVGFGDYYPSSSFEKVACVPIFLGGVMVFSYIMGKFADIVQFSLSIDDDLEEGESLDKFIGLLNKFNGKTVDHDFKMRLYNYF